MNAGIRRLTLVLLVLSLLLPAAALPAPAKAAAADPGSGLPVRTAQAIAAKWNELMQPQADPSKPYSAIPSADKPYAPGKLQSRYIQDAVDATNFYRFISGLPYDLVSTAELNEQAQYGSVLLAADDEFSHTPAKPADMPQSFYDKGLASTSSSNIYGSVGYNDHLAVRSVGSYMDDSDIYNLALIGHRRWILNPPLQEIGFGLAHSTSDWTYSAMQVFDDSRKEDVAFNFIAYPAAGAFPIEVFGPDQAWSISLNTELFAEPRRADVKVTLTRARDGRSWSLTSQNNKVAESGAYLNVDNEGYGSGSAIIFRPNGVGEYQAGDRFTVSIAGLKEKGGSAAKPVSYTVDFVSAANPDSTPAPEPGAAFTDISRSWAKETIEWASELGIVNGFPDGTFRPGDLVLEREFVKMFIEAMGGSVEERSGSEAWSAPYYRYADDYGYRLPGLTRSAFQVEPISRLAVAELIVSAAGQPYTGDDAITYLLDNGYSNGRSSPTVAGYEGDKSLTRAEAVQFIRNLLDAEYSL